MTATADILGLIFDLDGTLVDSMPLHFEAWTQALAEQGGIGIFPEDVFYAFGGRSAIDVVTTLNASFGLAMPPRRVAERKREIYIGLLHQRGVKPVASVMDFIASHSHLPRVIATGSALPGAMETLRIAGLDHMFPHIVTPADVVHGKPAPDMFLLAANRMNLAPAHCLVFEDAQPGIDAAAAAGMRCHVVNRHGEIAPA